MKRTRIASACLLLLLWPSVRLLGQTYRTFADERNEIRSAAGFRLGPFKLVPALRLYDVGRDSNIYYRSGEDEIVADFTGLAAGELRAHSLLGPSLILTVTDSPEYLFYLKERGLRAFTNSFSSGLRLLALRRLSLSAEYHARRHVRRPTSELTRLVEDTVEGWEGGLFFETARGTSLGLRGATDAFRYRDAETDVPDDPLARALDRRGSFLRFEFYYRVFTESYLFVSAGPSWDEFRFPESAWRNSRSFQARGGIRLPLLGRARGQVSLGWKSFMPESPEREPFSGLVSDSDIGVRIWRFNVKLGYARDNHYSFFETAYYYVEGRFRAGLSFYLTPFLRVDAEMRRSSLFYPEPQVLWRDGLPVTVVDRRDVLRVRSVGLVLRVAGRAGLGFSYNLYDRASNVPGFDIDRDFVGASLTYDF